MVSDNEEFPKLCQGLDLKNMKARIRNVDDFFLKQRLKNIVRLFMVVIDFL